MTDLPDDLQLKSLLSKHADYFDAPEVLRDKIMRQTKPQQSKGYGTMFSWLSAPIPGFAASFGIGVVVATLVTGQWMAGQQGKQAMLLALASDHARAVVTQNTIEVRSSSMHTVKPWLSSQLGYSPQVLDLADQGFPLVGGRRGFIGGAPVAVAVYAYRQHEIDVYVLRPAMYQQFPKSLDAVDGFNAMTWKAEGLHYIAISDMSAKQLKIFCNLLETSQGITQ